MTPSENLELKVEITVKPEMSQLQLFDKPIWDLILLRFLARRSSHQTSLEALRNHLFGIQIALRATPVKLPELQRLARLFIFEYLDRKYSEIIELAKNGTQAIGRVYADGDLDELIEEIDQKKAEAEIDLNVQEGPEAFADAFEESGHD